MLKFSALFALLFFAQQAPAKLLQVGASRTYTAPSAVMNLVADGDTVEIDAGLYSGDVGTWHANNLIIRCPNGMAHLDAAGKSAGGKAIWVVAGNNTYIANIEFSGCTLATDKNGAGIRQEGTNLELRHCYFHDNDDGVLAGANTSSDILFEACEFARNGFGDGYSHNMYIGNVHSFTMRFCYSHHAKIGHCVKSRAINNYILYNRIMDEDTGTASYLINLPNGGFSVIMGNTMMKGPNAQNRTLVDYGSEGLSNPSKQLYVVNNTMVSTRPSGATFVSATNGTDPAKIINNIFAGVGQIYSGIVDTTSNAYSSTINAFHFADPLKYDYRLSGDIIGYSPVIGANAGLAGSFSLKPTFEYRHPVDSLLRNDNLVGAFDNIDFKVNEKNISGITSRNFPNPFSEKTTIDLISIEDGSPVTLTISNQLGAEIRTEKYFPVNSQITFERAKMATGVYYYSIVNVKGERIAVGKFVIL